MKALSLFSGAGGADMALEAAGIAVVGLCEIEAHARAVLRFHWPNVRLHGDVCELDGAEYAGVDVVVGGSPCQDLSVAGRRGGMVAGSGTRSSLFYQQLRVWRESGAPYLIWENVDGAFSSGQPKGADFAALLSAIVGAAVAPPRAGAWARGGVAAGPDAVAAWRLLDLQHFGVPQRRERVVVLAARAGGVDPGEVLALAESMRGDPAPRYEAREGAAAAVAGGLGAGRGNARAEPDRGATVVTQEVVSPLTTGAGSRGGDHETFGGHLIVEHVPGVAHTLSGPGGGPNDQARITFVAQEVSPSVTAKWAKGSAGPAGDEVQNLVVAPHNPPVAHCLRGEGHDAGEDGTGRGTPNVIAPQNVALAFKISGGVEIDSAGKGAGKGYLGSEEVSFTLGVSQDQHLMAPAVDGLGVRMLTPLECERIMGWPDNWTRWGVDEGGKPYELKDTPRYKLCGNGIGREWMEWIALRLRAAVEA